MPQEHIFKLTASDSGTEPSEPPEKWPTYENMVAMFNHITDIAQPGDRVYIHYSGHGGRTKTNYPQLNGENGIDEALVPTNIGNSTARYLRDIELAKLLERMVDKKLVVTVVLDSCHSGGAIALSGVIRILDLFSYLQPKVTNDYPNQHPIPILKAEIEENFASALYLGGKEATPIPTTSPIDSYQYDVFISYYHKNKAEKTWVTKTLLPYLESKDLRVYGEFRFPLGAATLTTTERAIQQSRYTLVILSPVYIENSFAEFENVAAQHLGLEESKYRLIPIVREECTPRLGLRILFMLDMTDEDEFESNMERLVYQLKQPPSGRNG